MQRRPEQEVLATCEELGIGFEAYSPMGGGFLSGKYDKDTKFTGDDVRHVITRYNRENMEANQPLLDLLRAYAAEKQATPAQFALAWLLHKKDFIVPIPGMRKDERLAENFGAADVALSPEELAGIDKALGKIAIHGDRKDSDIVKLGTVQSVILE